MAKAKQETPIEAVTVEPAPKLPAKPRRTSSPKTPAPPALPEAGGIVWTTVHGTINGEVVDFNVTARGADVIEASDRLFAGLRHMADRYNLRLSRKASKNQRETNMGSRSLSEPRREAGKPAESQSPNPSPQAPEGAEGEAEEANSNPVRLQVNDLDQLEETVGDLPKAAQSQVEDPMALIAPPKGAPKVAYEQLVSVKMEVERDGTEAVVLRFFGAGHNFPDLETKLPLKDALRLLEGTGDSFWNKAKLQPETRTGYETRLLVLFVLEGNPDNRTKRIVGLKREPVNYQN
jgi:hypothetical protein